MNSPSEWEVSGNMYFNPGTFTMKNDIFTIAFFSFAMIILITLALFTGYEVGKQVNNDPLDNIIQIKRCGKVIKAID